MRDEVGMRQCPGYEEFIGAKKHLVLILTSEADPNGSNSLGTGL
jgi:hypothetical protein